MPRTAPDRMLLKPGTFAHTMIGSMIEEAVLTQAVVAGLRRMGATDTEAVTIIKGHGWCTYNPDGCPDPDAYRAYVHGEIDYATFLDRLDVRFVTPEQTPGEKAVTTPSLQQNSYVLGVVMWPDHTPTAHTVMFDGDPPTKGTCETPPRGTAGIACCSRAVPVVSNGESWDTETAWESLR